MHDRQTCNPWRYKVLTQASIPLNIPQIHLRDARDLSWLTHLLTCHRSNFWRCVLKEVYGSHPAVVSVEAIKIHGLLVQNIVVLSLKLLANLLCTTVTKAEMRPRSPLPKKVLTPCAVVVEK